MVKEEETAERFNTACAVRDSGDLHGALDLFETLLTDLDPGDERMVAGTNGVLGDIHLTSLGNAVRAEGYFRAALRLRPKAEHASTGLYFCLLDQFRQREALTEMIRFLSANDSNVYRSALKELRESLSARDRSALEDLLTTAEEMINAFASEE